MTSNTRYLLRENYREKGRIKHRTIANLSHCSAEEIAAIKLAFRYKHDLKQLSDRPKIEMKQGKSVGAIWLLFNVAKQIGLDKALGDSKEGKLALWQILARIISPSSRLSTVRLTNQHAVMEILKLEKFNEEDLYRNLDWLADKQKEIEDSLFKQLGEETPTLFLYDVTSSYLEGKCNELADFGYNRDGKKGKQQIVIGLLCNEQGIPISVEVFKGNTNDCKTITSQIKKSSW